jgi:hypothetical protein
LAIKFVKPVPHFLVYFPTSISERGARVAAIISVDDNCERACDEWLLIKSVNADKVEHMLPLVDMELSAKLGAECPEMESACEPRRELERRVEAANGVLAQDRWRRFPYLTTTRQGDYIDPAVEWFDDVEVEFKDARLRVAYQGRTLISERKPAWAYRGVYRGPSRECMRYGQAAVETVAFDPETGILLLGLKYWAPFEGCAEPRWDFHPIRLPTLRRKAVPGRDGGPP